jgi:DNA-binding NarL/FixJ family response regulator
MTRVFVLTNHKGVSENRHLLPISPMAWLDCFGVLVQPIVECCSLIQTVLKNRPYLSPTANAEYLIALQSGRKLSSLCSEGQAVLNYLTQGISVNQIARRLGITPRKVYSIRDRLRRRFGVETNEHLISRAVAEGFSTFSKL